MTHQAEAISGHAIPLDARIYVTGHRGLVGSAILRQLRRNGFENLLTATRARLDLRDQTAVDQWFASQQIDYVFHCAGHVGGILANATQPADFLYDNLLIHACVLRSAWQYPVKKLLYLGSSCIYPRDCPQPIREEYLLTGPLEATNDAYAIAKISGVLSCQAYRRQHGCNFISAMPTNLYGPHDNFDLTSSHVLPALIRRFYDAKQAGQGRVTAWGSGKPRREFLHVDDLAAACLFLIENYDAPEPINVGTGVDVTIRELAESIRDVVHPECELEFDTSKPDGTPRKLLDVSKIRDLGWTHRTSLLNGIRDTYSWFLAHNENQQASGTSAQSSSKAVQPLPQRKQTVMQMRAKPHGTRDLPPRCGRRAMITGISGQDGSYLAELLIAKGYDVWGIVRRSSSFNTARLEQIYQDPHEEDVRLQLRYGDLSDSSSLNHIIEEIEPDEVYNLGAQSHVKVSFDIPEYTSDITGLGAVRLLEAIRKLAPEARFYQASSSELYGKVRETPQSETTPFHPRSPYAVAKEFAFSMTRNYREAYGMFAVNGILFNHESPRRGETFVTRKISRAVAAIVHGNQETLYLGNLEAKRDWGFAGDYVKAMWMMLQAGEPDDYVIATGQTHTVREFCEIAFDYAGLPLTWHGQGVDEIGLAQDGRTLVRVDPRYFRPAEVDLLLGDPTKAAEELGWAPTVLFPQLVEMMVDADLRAIWPRAIDERLQSNGELPTSRHPQINEKPLPDAQLKPALG